MQETAKRAKERKEMQLTAEVQRAIEITIQVCTRTAFICHLMALEIAGGSLKPKRIREPVRTGI
jgi:hypothetical protein